MKTIFQVVTLSFALILMALVTPAARQSRARCPNAPVMTAQAVVFAMQTQDVARQGQTGQPQSEPEPNSGRRLPLTEGPLPLFALLGFLSIGGILVLRKISRILF